MGQVGAATVATDAQEVDFVEDRKPPHQVGVKHHSSLEDTHQNGNAVHVLFGKLAAQFGDPPLNVIAWDQYAIDQWITRDIFLIVKRHETPPYPASSSECEPAT